MISKSDWHKIKTCRGYYIR